jgi:hypothetical protein
MNPHIDAVPLAHAGRTATIRFTWRALTVLQRDWGDEWTRRFVDALSLEKVDDLAELVAIASGMTAEEVMDWSPPTAVTVAALWDAYGLTKLGRKPEADEAEATENPLGARSILSKASALLRFARVSPGPTSGSKPPTPPASH